jgi:predicted ATPase/DNA-binding SARP family transcriptional activator
MALLSLNFLGSFQVSLDEIPLTAFRSDKDRALLAYLALESDRPHRRETLAGLFWAELPEDAALNNLRKALHHLRQQLDDEKSAPSFLLVTTKTIQFNPQSRHRLDVTEFLRVVDHTRHHLHRHLTRCQTCHAAYLQAANLYRGDFLKGFSLPDSVAFDEWLVVRREQFRLQALDVLQQLADYAEWRADWDQVQFFAQKQVEIEPWRETAQRQLIQALAYKGNRAGALAQYETCRRILHSELAVAPEAETVALYEKLKRGDPWEAVSGPPHNLPAALTPLIGRETEQADLQNILLTPTERLVTIIGEGGIGKTKLALQIARKLRYEFTDGVWFVNLAGLAGESSDISQAIGAALDISFSGAAEPKTQLFSYLHSKECLLVLDNFEHLLSNAELVAELLTAAPQLVILVTSREPLQLQAEQVFRLDTLPVPEADVELAQANEFSSVRLFVERAHRASGEFRLSVETVAPVVEICRLVEGLPLGLVLAAAQTYTATPAEIVVAVQQSFDSFGSTLRDLPSRQRSIRAVFEWSWKLLTATEQSVLARLSVFRGGFTAEAGQAVALATPESLAALVKKSLLRESGGRYELHTLVRQFSQSKLQSDPAITSEVQSRHQHYYTEWVGNSESSLSGPAPKLSTQLMQADLENIQAAWQHALHHLLIEDLARAIGGLALFYDRVGLYREGERTFRLAQEYLIAQLPETTTRVSKILSQLSAEVSRFHVLLTSKEGAYQFALQAVTFAQQAAWIKGETIGYLRLGYAEWMHANYVMARQHFDRGLALAQQYNFLDYEAYARRGLSLIDWRQGDLVAARANLEQAMMLYQQIGDKQAEMRSAINLGIMLIELSFVQEAQVIVADCLKFADDVRDRSLQQIASNLLGQAAKKRGDYEQAQIYYEASLKHSLESSNVAGQITSIANLGDVALKLGQYGRARAYYDQALDLARRSNGPQYESHILSYLGQLCVCLDENERARDYGQQALAIAEKVGVRREQAYALTCLGHAYFKLEELDRSADCYQKAVECWRAVGDRYRALECIAGLAQIALTRSDRLAAQERVETILQHLTTDTFIGADDPFRVYWISYLVLRSNKDRRADALLKDARHLLSAQADKIQNPDLRRTFLERVPSHAAIMAEA